jgi:hypothetical protein
VSDMSVYHPKIISFCLWGGNECYNYMALENVLMAQKLYPDWMCYIYYSPTCIPKIIHALKIQPNVRLIFINEPINKASNTFWRFIPCFDSSGVVLVRDCDSILNERERRAVDEFLDSSCNFHIMRDSPYHRHKIMAGMWGCRNGILSSLRDDFKRYINAIPKDDDRRSIDENWLDEYVYPHIIDAAIVHASANIYEETAKRFPYSSYTGKVGAIILYAPLTREIFGEDNIKLVRRPQYKF